MVHKFSMHNLTISGLSHLWHLWKPSSSERFRMNKVTHLGEQKERETAGKPRYLLKHWMKSCHPNKALLVSLFLSFFLRLCVWYQSNIAQVKQAAPLIPACRDPRLLSAQLLEPFTEQDNNAINYNTQQSKREREKEKRSIEASSVAIIV